VGHSDTDTVGPGLLSFGSTHESLAQNADVAGSSRNATGYCSPRPRPTPAPRPTPPGFLYAEAWVARYAGPNNGHDIANAIAVDSLGNVYVTGSSYVGPGRGSNYDYAMIKYDSAGQQQWVAPYNRSGNADDEARAIAVDTLGNVYVTGSSAGWTGIQTMLRSSTTQLGNNSGSPVTAGGLTLATLQRWRSMAQTTSM